MREGNGTDGDIWTHVPTLLAAAHELKSPLVLIRQLALQLNDPVAATSAEAALRIRLTAERSLVLLEGLTRAARLDDALFESEPINVAELCEAVADEMMPLARAPDQRIEVGGARHAPSVVGNRMLLRSILTGLCDNALTHNDKSRPVVLMVRAQSELIEVGVRDFGPHTGSLSDMKRRLGTQPQPISQRPRSSGLGLLIAEQFASHMDTTLSLRRHRDAGITLSLRLPRSKQLSLLEAL